VRTSCSSSSSLPTHCEYFMFVFIIITHPS
jgi:hypothetical protein